MSDVLADAASGEQCFSHTPPGVGAGCPAVIAAWQSGAMLAMAAIDIDIDIGIECAWDAELVVASGIVHASADIASCCNSRQALSSNTITERWRWERTMAGI